jgi:plastocyanin
MNFLRSAAAAALAGGLLLAGTVPALAQGLPVDAPTVQLQGNAFLPGDAFVPAGTTVVFTNLDAEEHDVVPNDPNFSLDMSFFSPVIAPGESWAFTFTVPGTYAYMCDLHANMTGTLTVA